MITVKLQGGLGNQMFQYAFGRTAALHLGAKLCLANNFYDTSRNRVLELDKFAIIAETRKLSFVERCNPFNVFREINPADYEAYKKVKNGAIIDGYWQSEKYFKKISGEIRKEFSLKDQTGREMATWREKINHSEAISIHIRRGDYTEEKHQKIYGLVGLEYYKKSTEFIAANVKNPTFFVFSDDILWAKENLKIPYPTEFVSDGKISAPEEIFLMSLCKNHIIANSSFSWWGAWLNPNSKKQVVAPKNWFANPTRDSSDIIPNEWTKI